MLVRLLLTCCLALATLGSDWRAQSPNKPSAPVYLVAIVMDGFRPDYFALAPMKHLHALMQRGMSYSAAWVGQMESETPSGHATIATGVYPRKHGVVGFGWRDPTTGSFTYMPTDLRQISTGSLARQMAQASVPTLSDLVHARNRHDLVVSISGEKYYASATFGAGADYILYGKDDTKGHFRPTPVGSNVPPASTHFRSVVGDSSIESQDAFASSLAVQLVRTVRPRALLLNLPGTDIGGHYYGALRDRSHMAAVVRAADWAIGRVVNEYKRQGLLNRTVFVVTADHGMASNRHIVPIRRMYDAVRQIGAGALDEEFRISVGSIWLRDPQHAASVAAALAGKRFSGVEGTLYRDAAGAFQASSQTAQTLPRSLLQAYLDLANTEAGPTGPDVLLPYGEDTTGLTVKGRSLWGSHGGFSWGVQHIPLIVAGPGIRHGVSRFPAKLVDIAPTIERLIGLPVPSGVDGVVLGDALTSSPQAERAAQTAVQQHRLADVRAIETHSLQQSKR